MLERLQERWLPMLLTFIILSTGFFQFLTVYGLTERVVPLLIVAAVCLITGLVQKARFKIPLFILIYFASLYYYFPYEENFSFHWLSVFTDQSLGRLRQMATGELGYLPNELAMSLILFFVLSLAIFQIYYEQWQLCSAMVIGYLLLIAVFNRTNLSPQIIIIAGCSLMFHLHLTLQDEEAIFQQKKVPLIVGTIILVVLGLGSLFLPMEGVRNNIVENTASVRNYFNEKGLYSAIQQYGLPAPSKTGFSENDSELGGPLLDENTILFDAKQEKGHYWRVESKDFYSGNGWLKSYSLEPEIFTNTIYRRVDEEYQHSYHPMQEIEVEFYNHGNYIPLPYGQSAILVTNGLNGVDVDEESGRVNFYQTAQNAQLSLSWLEPDYQSTDLQNVSITYPETFIDYLQLPSELPSRVEDLALEITKDSRTLYDKVTAIEDYLKNSGELSYSKTDTPYTPEGEDYVDYFLFESKVGYCDNFSSAMVVMLRSIGIPARWVKGFSEGEQTGTDENGLATYSIRNSNAHAWVEVYFDSYGWVPFEPTTSFVNPDRPGLTEDSGEDSSSSAASSSETSASASLESSAASSSDLTEDDFTDEASSAENFQILLRVVFAILLIALVLASVYLLRKYYFLIHIYVLLKISANQLLAAYPILLKQAEKHLYRSESEALVAYAIRFEEKFDTFQGAFLQLTLAYEKELFGKPTAPANDQTDRIKQVGKLMSQVKKK